MHALSLFNRHVFNNVPIPHSTFNINSRDELVPLTVRARTFDFRRTFPSDALYRVARMFGFHI